MAIFVGPARRFAMDIIVLWSIFWIDNLMIIIWVCILVIDQEKATLNKKHIFRAFLDCLSLYGNG